LPVEASVSELPPATCAPDWITAPVPPAVPESDGSTMVEAGFAVLTLSVTLIVAGLSRASLGTCTVTGLPLETRTSVPSAASSAA
jgi:hypothetical protein